MNEDHVKTTIANYKALRELAEAITWKIYAVDPRWQEPFNYKPYIDKLIIKDDEIRVRLEANACSRGCCGTDVLWVEFPLSPIYGRTWT